MPLTLIFLLLSWFSVWSHGCSVPRDFRCNLFFELHIHFFYCVFNGWDSFFYILHYVDEPHLWRKIWVSSLPFRIYFCFLRKGFISVYSLYHPSQRKVRQHKGKYELKAESGSRTWGKGIMNASHWPVVILMFIYFTIPPRPPTHRWHSPQWTGNSPIHH